MTTNESLKKTEYGEAQGAANEGGSNNHKGGKTQDNLTNQNKTGSE